MSIRAASTMLAALHGTLERHPWRDPSAASSDPYRLFVARSSAMGWLAEATGPGRAGVWGMNDAGEDQASGPKPSRVAWFQVALQEPLPAGRALPVQALLACAGDVVARAGTLHLHAVQVLMPLESVHASTGGDPGVSAVMTLLQDAGWFADCDPRSRAQVEVTLDSGQEPSIRAAAPGMLQWMQAFDQDVVLIDSLSLTADAATNLDPRVTDELWLGPSQRRVSLHGTLAEWSLDAVGWLAAYLAEASSRHGVHTPLLLTVIGSAGSSPNLE